MYPLSLSVLGRVPVGWSHDVPAAALVGRRKFRGWIAGVNGLEGGGMGVLLGLGGRGGVVIY